MLILQQGLRDVLENINLRYGNKDELLGDGDGDAVVVFTEETDDGVIVDDDGAAVVDAKNDDDNDDVNDIDVDVDCESARLCKARATVANEDTVSTFIACY